MKSMRPPSTVITWPVMKLDSSEARKTATLAISSGSPTLRRMLFSVKY
jgi:hypothetical protein